MHLDSGMDALVLEGTDDFQPGPVPHVGQALVSMSPEMPHVDVALAVGGAVKDGSPFFQLPDPVRGLLGVDLVADISSCGNVDIGIEGVNGRFKPDVVAPGIFIVSARSTNYMDPTNVSSSTEKSFPAQNVEPGRTNIYTVQVPSKHDEPDPADCAKRAVAGAVHDGAANMV